MKPGIGEMENGRNLYAYRKGHGCIGRHFWFSIGVTRYHGIVNFRALVTCERIGTRGYDGHENEYEPIQLYNDLSEMEACMSVLEVY